MKASQLTLSNLILTFLVQSKHADIVESYNSVSLLEETMSLVLLADELTFSHSWQIPNLAAEKSTFPLPSKISSKDRVICNTSYRQTIIQMFIRLKTAIGIFSNFSKIVGVGSRPNQRQRISQRFPDHSNPTYLNNELQSKSPGNFFFLEKEFQAMQT